MITDEIVGQRFGKLVVERFSHFYVKPSDGKKEKRWLCRCDCGGTTITSKRKLQTGWTESCGCLLKTRKGLTKYKEYQPTYSVWNMMIQRCMNPNFTSNGNYYGRISVCEEWLGDEGFQRFIEDMGLRPSCKHSIERIDVNGNYNPQNCIWTDDGSRQAFNQRVKKSNTSGKTGVAYDGSRKKPWVATISKMGTCYKKTFHTFEEAAKQRDEWEIQLYGFLKDNTPREDL